MNLQVTFTGAIDKLFKRKGEAKKEIIWRISSSISLNYWYMFNLTLVTGFL